MTNESASERAICVREYRGQLSPDWCLTHHQSVWLCHAALEAERDELTRLMNHSVCTYCGTIGPKPEPWSREGWVEIIQAHLADCPTHPANMYLKAMAENAALIAERAQSSKAAITNQATFLREVDALKAELQACYGEICPSCVLDSGAMTHRNDNGVWIHYTPAMAEDWWPCRASRARERAYQREQAK